MANTVYISAGLPVAKNSGQSPTSQVNTVYVSAGLPPQELSAELNEQRVNAVGHGRPWLRTQYPVASQDVEWRASVGLAYGEFLESGVADYLLTVASANKRGNKRGTALVGKQ